jgi:hypothetical protein
MTTRWKERRRLLPRRSSVWRPLEPPGKVLRVFVLFFQGFNNLPLLNILAHANPSRVDVVRSYPKIRTFGADIAVPLHWLTLKAESAWFQSRSGQADEYLLYVVQLERQSGEWLTMVKAFFHANNLESKTAE